MVDCRTASGLEHKTYLDKDGGIARAKFQISDRHEAWLTTHGGRAWFHICEFKRTKRGANFDKEKVGIFTLPGDQVRPFLETMEEMMVMLEEAAGDKLKTAKEILIPQKRPQIPSSDVTPFKRVKLKHYAGPSAKTP